MPKSRRVVRKSRKTRGRKGSRRLRGGFFGKLFEGFQMAQTALTDDAVMPTTVAQSNMMGTSGNVGTMNAIDMNATSTSVAQGNMLGRESAQSSVTAMQDTKDISATTSVAAPPPPKAAEGPVGVRYNIPGVVAVPPPPPTNLTAARAPIPAMIGPVIPTGARSAIMPPPPPVVRAPPPPVVRAPPPPRGPMKMMRGGRRSRKSARKAARKGRKASRRH